MPGFMTDLTPNVSKHRGDEIAQWLNECNVKCNYVIIDDLNSENFNKDQTERLVTVNPYYGLDKDATLKAISIIMNHNRKKENE